MAQSYRQVGCSAKDLKGPVRNTGPLRRGAEIRIIGRMRLLAFLVFTILGAPLAVAEEVDVELFLAVDVSRSMQPFELEIQRRGYAEALVSDAVVDAVESGLLGKVALTYVEWAGNRAHRVIVDWTIVESRDDLQRFADQLSAHFEPSMRRTSISGAIEFATKSIEENGLDGLRRVIDISGDGPNNQGRIVTVARDMAVEKGITINGLPLMTKDDWTRSGRWHLEDLDTYYVACVIGGFGAFAIPVVRWEEFAGAVRQKLVLEIAGLPPVVVPAANRATNADGSIDCEIGEKIWQRNRELIDDDF